ncbi:MAG: hypothetical protein CVU22_13900 [Betaproteobacteria bacterium HGW-Betaproteobacteria-16]|nr:MAG: hypothetical protein CVU22_13900 [Betaproteobacteria bacterium HGW-Betaproteobacteria-16]
MSAVLAQLRHDFSVQFGETMATRGHAYPIHQLHNQRICENWDGRAQKRQPRPNTARIFRFFQHGLDSLWWVAKTRIVCYRNGGGGVTGLGAFLKFGVMPSLDKDSTEYTRSSNEDPISIGCALSAGMD